MNLKGRPFAISTAIASVLLLGSAFLGQLASRRQLEALFQPGIAMPDITAMRGSWLLSMANCLMILVVVIGCGSLYAYLHHRAEPVSGTDAALGGALVGGLSYGITSLLSVAFTMMILPDMIAQINAIGGPSGASLPPEMGTIMAVAGAVGGIFGACFGIVLGSLLGGTGAFLTSAVLNRGQI